MPPPPPLIVRWRQAVPAHWPFYVAVLALAVLCKSLWAEAPKDLGKVLAAIQKAHAAGEPARVEEYVQAWLPRIAHWHFFVCIALMLIGPLLTGWEKHAAAALASPDDNHARRWLKIVTLAMIAFSAVMNSPRLSHSFWADEEWTARRLVVGEFHDNPNFRQPSWKKTLFFYNDPNNHPLFSALSRVSFSLFATPQDKSAFCFQEWTMRLPAFLFGLGGFAAVAWLASVMGLPRAGMLAVIWLALHPWQVRYGVDARGYALLLTLLPLSMGAVWRAVQTGSMNWWLGFGLTEFFVLWAYPGALYFVLLLNLAACGIMLTAKPPVPRSLQWRRYAAGSLIGALLTSLLLSPCVQPMLLYLKGGRIHGQLDGRWMAETASGLFTGIPWASWDTHDLALSWMRTWSHAPWLVVLMLILIGAAGIAGVITFWRAGGLHRWMAGLILAIGPFMFLMARAQGNILYPWYLIICLPGMAIVLGSGIESLAKWSPCRARCPLMAAWLIVFGFATWPQCHLLRTLPIEPMRESVEAMRPERNARTADLGRVLTASVIFPARLYDPAAVQVDDVKGLQALMERADREHLPLFVNFADKEFLKLRNPALVNVLDDDRLFESLPPFWGIHGQRERRVCHYKGQAKP